LIANRKLKAAHEEFERAVDLDPEEPESHRSLATLLTITKKRNEAKACLEKALSLDPEEPSLLSDLGELYLSQGDLAAAHRYARSALEASPEHAAALVLMANLLLRRGDITAAREHAIWALRNQPTSEGALRVTASIKARQSIFLGLWWRFNTWAGEVGSRRAILVLLVAFSLQRVLGLYAEQHGLRITGEIIQYTWFAICAYSWTGPALARAVQRELATVALSKSF
jgi:tetratricopeptide (TPR) repeat protein